MALTSTEENFTGYLCHKVTSKSYINDSAIILIHISSVHFLKCMLEIEKKNSANQNGVKLAPK